METLASEIRVLDEIFYNELIDLNSIFWHISYSYIARMVMNNDRLRHIKSSITGCNAVFVHYLALRFLVVAFSYFAERLLYSYLKVNQMQGWHKHLVLFR